MTLASLFATWRAPFPGALLSPLSPLSTLTLNTYNYELRAVVASSPGSNNGG